MRRVRDMVLGGVLVLALVGVGFFGRGIAEGQGSTDGKWELVEGEDFNVPVGTPLWSQLEFVKRLPAGCDVASLQFNGEDYVFYRCE